MKLEEARKVLWLKSNPRPFGELLDEGYLTQERLEWAAQWAYNPKQKQAAQVLLEARKSPTPKVEEEPKLAQPVDNALPISVSLEKARATPWPLPPLKGQPMGPLVESKQLSLKDLGYAIENAWDEKVRQAAIALTLVRLDQIVKEPVPSAGFVKVISGGRSYSERKQLWINLLEGMVFGILFGILLLNLVISLIYGGRSSSSDKQLSDILSSPSGIIALVIILVLVIGFISLFNFIVGQLDKRLNKEFEEHRLGQEGEERTGQLIAQVLDGNWHIFRNISLPGRNKGDLDHVLVGPPGVWVLEVKNYRGEFRNSGENWEMRQGKRWKTAFASPSRQVFNNALRLANFLKADNLKVFVNAVVIWANPESPLTVENPSVAIWQYDRLPDELGNIWQGEKLPKDERAKIVAKLSKLCEGQKKK